MAAFVYHFRTNRNKLDEMLFLRATGWSYTALAERYECPKLTIRFLARKNNLNGNIAVQFTHQQFLRATTTQPKVEVPLEEKISEGKTYVEYLKEEKERKKIIR